MSLGCGGCGLAYKDPGWVDVLIPTELWVQISPSENSGGVLCMTCIARRLVARGFEHVPMIVTSGPWAYVGSGAHEAIRSPLPLKMVPGCPVCPESPAMLDDGSEWVCPRCGLTRVLSR